MSFAVLFGRLTETRERNVMDLPLPLMPVEEFMFHDDRPTHPWNIFLRLRFSGCVDRRAAEIALRSTVDRHPLLRAIVSPAARNGFVWTPQPDAKPEIEWITGPVATPFPPAPYLDLRRQIGLRMQGILAEDRSEVVFQFHHSCCDGKGALQFAEDWMTAYAHCVKNGDSTQTQGKHYDQRCLPHRNQYGLTPLKRLAMAPIQILGLARTWRFVTRTPVPLTDCEATAQCDSPPAGFPATCCHCFDETTTADFVAAAKRSEGTVNDLLLRDLFAVLADWRAGRELGAPEEWLRLMVPVNLRTEAEENLSAANVVSGVFLTRRRQECMHGDKLLGSIHREMESVKRWRLSLAFVRGLGILKRLPDGLLKTAHSKKCMTTAALTNVGMAFADSRLPRRDGRLVAGDIVLQEAGVLAPIRPQTNVCFGVTTYAGRMTVNMQYDPVALSGEQAEELFEGYLNRLRASRG